MFTGIVKTTGKLKQRREKKGKIYFVITVDKFLEKVEVGDSISCDGACLTVIEKRQNYFTVELMPETLKLTRFQYLDVNSFINLEKSMKFGGRIDGHFVMGHVDAVGRIKKIIQGKANTDLVISVPKKIVKYLAYKGSISVNGVSLTIAESKNDWIKVCLITHTLEITNLSELKKGDRVNLEVDMIARYLERLLKKDKKI